MRYERLTSPEIARLDPEQTLFLLPLGAVEQHGAHMPIGTDSIISHAVCTAAADKHGATVVLPPPWYGFSPHHMRFAGSITLGAETLTALVTDIVGSLVAQGGRRILLVNGHGGNGSLVDLLSSTLGRAHYGKARIAGVTYFRLAAADIDRIRESEPGGTGHAGEFETSVMLHLRPDLVDQQQADTVYPDPGSPYLTTDLTGASAVATYRDFADLSPTGVLGDPSLASAEKGERFFVAAAAALHRFMEDFAQWPIQTRTP
ncbi:MAG: creatininase family protein [Hyphomicrobiales bacterium]|nr:creatininase family protein [Hyphomicrobiales bacterium]